MSFNPKPGYVCSFAMQKNPNKTEAKHPDLVLINHMTKNGKQAPKNFTIKLNGQDVWCQASGYKQEDGSVKITITQTDTNKKQGFAPKPAYNAAAAEDFI
jgi:hypothetical protein